MKKFIINSILLSIGVFSIWGTVVLARRLREWSESHEDCKTVYYIDRRWGIDEAYDSLSEAKEYAGEHVIKPRERCIYNPQL